MKSPSIAERFLSKNKKYYSYQTIRKDKENVFEGDISSIIQKLKEQQNANKVTQSSRPNRRQR